MIDLKVKDSGERKVYESGAMRDNNVGKGRMDLLPPEAILRLSRWYESGALKYKDHNWETGMNISRYLDAAIRHLFKYMAGCADEDHLAAVAWNVLAIMHHEAVVPEMQDLPSWKDRKSPYIYDLDKG
jgi:hypothetical protein